MYELPMNLFLVLKLACHFLGPFYTGNIQYKAYLGCTGWVVSTVTLADISSLGVEIDSKTGLTGDEAASPFLNKKVYSTLMFITG